MYTSRQHGSKHSSKSGTARLGSRRPCVYYAIPFRRFTVTGGSVTSW